MPGGRPPRAEHFLLVFELSWVAGKTYSLVNLGASLLAVALEVLLGVNGRATGEVALDLGSGVVGIACEECVNITVAMRNWGELEDARTLCLLLSSPGVSASAVEVVADTCGGTTTENEGKTGLGHDEWL